MVWEKNRFGVSRFWDYCIFWCYIRGWSFLMGYHYQCYGLFSVGKTDWFVGGCNWFCSWCDKVRIICIYWGFFEGVVCRKVHSLLPWLWVWCRNRNTDVDGKYGQRWWIGDIFVWVDLVGVFGCTECSPVSWIFLYIVLVWCFGCHFSWTRCFIWCVLILGLLFWRWCWYTYFFGVRVSY